MKSRTPLTIKFLLALTAMALICTSLTWAADDKDKDQSDIDKRIDQSAKVLSEIMATPDKAVPDKIMNDAKCIAVVPSMVKIAIGFGGNHGKGVATCRTEHGWSAPAPITITGGSWGLQLGGQAVDLVMIVMNDQGMEHLLSSHVKLGADASAAAGPVGRHASAGTDWKLDTQMLTYSRSKGAFAGLTLEGAVIQQDEDSTNAIYGKDAPFRSVLLGKVPTPELARPFVQSVDRAAHKADVKEAADEKK